MGRLLRFEVVARREHVEIALRDPLDQILLRSPVVRFGLRDGVIRALQVLPVLPAEDVLAQGHVPLGGHRPYHARDILLHLDEFVRIQGVREKLGGGLILRCPVLFHRRRSGDLRQKERAGLRLGFQCGHARGSGLAHLRIALQGVVVDLQKVIRNGRPRQSNCPECDGQLDLHTICLINQSLTALPIKN